MATILNPNGLLAYGDNDGSVIWRSPLTSLASITTPEIGGQGSLTQENGGVYDFHPTRGFRSTIPTNGSSILLTNITNNISMQYGGQVTFQLTRAMLACSAATAEGSTGGTPQPGIEYPIIFSAFPLYSANSYIETKLNAKTLEYRVGYGGNINGLGAQQISDAADVSEFATIHIVFNGNKTQYFIDGIPLSSFDRSNNMPQPFYHIFLGRGSGGYINNLISGYIRNLQLSTRFTSFPVNPVLSNVCAFGDSYAATNTNAWTASSFNYDKAMIMGREFNRLGFAMGSFQNQSYGGRSIIGSGNPAIHLYDNIPAMLATNPTTIVFQAGANDFGTGGTLNVANFTAAMKTFIEKWFGVNGNPSTSVRRAVICTTPWPPNYPSAAVALLKQADHTLGNNVQKTLPAWFSATYPALAGRVVVNDTFKDFGGFNPDPLLYAYGDPIHPSIGKGWSKMGMSWASGVISALG